MRVVVAKKPYKGRAVGSEVEVSGRIARVLMAVGLAVRYAEPEPVIEPEPEPVREKRSYRRRDMTAED